MGVIRMLKRLLEVIVRTLNIMVVSSYRVNAVSCQTEYILMVAST